VSPESAASKNFAIVADTLENCPSFASNKDVGFPCLRVRSSNCANHGQPIWLKLDEIAGTLGRIYGCGRDGSVATSPFAESSCRPRADRVRTVRLSNPRCKSASSLSMLQSLNTHSVNASCSVPWSMSSVHLTNSQSSKRVKTLLPRSEMLSLKEVRGENANPSQAIATSRFAPCAVNEFMNRDRQIARLVVVNSKLSGRTVL